MILYYFAIGWDTSELLIRLSKRIQKVSSNENQSEQTTQDVAVDVGIKVEAALGHKLTSSQVNINQSLYLSYSHMNTIMMIMSLNETCFLLL